NRLVLPAPFGPTIPTVSPAPTANDTSSTMTTWPKRFVTWPSSSSGLVIRSGVRWQQGAGDLRLRQQRVVDDLHLQRIRGSLLPLHADGRGDRDAGGGILARGEVQRPGQRVDVDVVDGVGDFGLVVRVVHGHEGRVRDLEQAVVAQVGVPLSAAGRLVVVGELLACLAGEGGRPRQGRHPPG